MIKKTSNLILTLSQLNWEYYIRKGLDTFVDLAEQMTEYHFVIVGKDHKDGVSKFIKKLKIKNLSLIDHVNDNELKNI